LENIEPENAMSVLDYCVDTVIDAQFEKRALQVVSHNAKEVFRSETFITAANKSIAAVLRLDALSISEDDVFQWVNPPKIQ
jgi:hypothetical protein